MIHQLLVGAFTLGLIALGFVVVGFMGYVALALVLFGARVGQAALSKWWTL